MPSVYSSARVKPELSRATPADWIATLSRLVERIAVQKDALQIRLRRQQVVEWLGIGTNELQTEGTAELSVPIQFRQRGNQVRVVVPAAGDERTRTPDRTLLGIIARAMAWRQRIERGEVNSLREIAKAENVNPSYVGRLLPLAYLAPDIVEFIMNGQQPVELSAQQLLYRKDLSNDWSRQRQQLGFNDL